MLRPSPSSDALREAFRREVKRRQRQSDGTISLDGVRFEIPSRYRHFRDVVVRYPRWDLSLVDLVDPRQGTVLARLFPLDRAANADGRRAVARSAAGGGFGQRALAIAGRTAAAAEANPGRILGHGSATGLLAEERLAEAGRGRRCRMSTKKLLALWGLKWNPFTPELPGEALLVTPQIEHFAWRVEQLVQEGGFALISGESGTGKSVALRIVAQRLAAVRDVMVGVVERPQSKSADFYRELGDIFSVQLRPSNRWGGFRALRERWKAHVASTRIKPVLLIDEAQEMDPHVLSELRILASADFDATSLVDRDPLRRRAVVGVVASGGPRSLGNPHPHAAPHRTGLAGRTAGAPAPRLVESR